MLGAVPPASNLLAFVAVAAVVILIPGPSVLFTVGRALSAGRREALLTVIGNAAGEAVQVVAVAVGLGSVISASTRCSPSSRSAERCTWSTWASRRSAIVDP